MKFLFIQGNINQPDAINLYNIVANVKDAANNGSSIYRKLENLLSVCFTIKRFSQLSTYKTLENLEEPSKSKTPKNKNAKEKRVIFYNYFIKQTYLLYFT